MPSTSLKCDLWEISLQNNVLKIKIKDDILKVNRDHINNITSVFGESLKVVLGYRTALHNLGGISVNVIHRLQGDVQFVALALKRGYYDLKKDSYVRFWETAALIPLIPLELTINLENGRVDSNVEELRMISEALSKFNAPAEQIIEAIYRLDRDLRKLETWTGHIDANGKWISAVATIDVRKMIAEYKLPMQVPYSRSVALLFLVNIKYISGKEYLTVKGESFLYPYSEKISFDLNNYRLMYSDDYGNKVVKFWEIVKEKGLPPVGDKVQVKILEMLKSKPIEDVIRYYERIATRISKTIEKNEKIRALYEKLLLEGSVDLNGSKVVLVPYIDPTLLVINGRDCILLKSQSLKKYGIPTKPGILQRKRGTLKVLRWLADKGFEGLKEKLSEKQRIDEFVDIYINNDDVCRVLAELLKNMSDPLNTYEVEINYQRKIDVDRAHSRRYSEAVIQRVLSNLPRDLKRLVLADLI